MVHYKLTYFNGRGRAEVMRYLFAYTDTAYEDVRVEREAWADMKKNTVFGQLPQLEIDGVTIAQSNAMARYFARQKGLAGKSPLEEAQCDMIVDFMEDMIKPLVAIFTAPEDKKEELKKKYLEEQAPDMMGKLEKILEANKGGNGFIVGDAVTWADFSFIQGISFPASMSMELKWDHVPKLKALKERVESLPKIKAWIEKRPKTEF